MVSSAAATRAVTRVQLGMLLRAARGRAGVSIKESAEILDWYPAKVTKVEKGGAIISSAELDRLIDRYEVPEEQAAKMRKLGKEGRRRRTMERVPDWAQMYVELEQAATTVKLYDGELVLGLLQTEEYAHAVLSTSSVLGKPVGVTSDEAESRAADRVRRRERFMSNDAPELWAVLGEAALHRAVGGTGVLRGQLKLLREMAELRTVTFGVLPFSSGEHVALGASFYILELPDPPVTYVYLEGLTDADYLDKAPHTDAYTLAFNRLLVAAANERESKRMLDRRIKELAD